MSEEMKIVVREGACIYCGQVGLIEAPEHCSQEKINSLVSSKCVCADAQLRREEEDRLQVIRMHIDAANKAIPQLFDDWKEAENLFLAMTKTIATGTISSVSIKMEDSDTRASMSRKADGSIKISRKDSTTRQVG